MPARRPLPAPLKTNTPWYRHRWPWLLMLGPILVVAAGIHTTWIAFSEADTLVVDDYYRQGKAINQDLHRDRVASGMRLQAHMAYDAAIGQVVGTIKRQDQPLSGKLSIHLIHATQPDKDVQLRAVADQQGKFTANLPMLDRARWQVSIESEQRDWRLKGVWAWPQQARIVLKAEALPDD